MDSLTLAERSRLMSRVRSKNTKPEMAIRSFLHRRGLRFKVHDRSLSGSPDLVFPRWRTVLFVNGCFWHGHDGCKRAALPKTNRIFWRNKIANNIKRDKRAALELKASGWKVLYCWTCDISEKSLTKLHSKIVS